MTTAYRVVFLGDPPVGHLECVSDACAALIGLEADEVIAHPGVWSEAIHPDDRDAFVQTTAQVILNGVAVDRSYRLRHPETGAYRMVQDHLTATLHEDGHVIGYEAVVTLAN